MERRTELLLRFWRFLDRQEVAYCVVGDSRELPIHVNSDVDMVVGVNTYTNMRWLMDRFCADQGVALVQHLEHEQTATYYVLAWPDEQGSPAFLALDVCSDYYRNGRRLLAAEELLQGRRLADERDVLRRFWVPSPALAFIYYLIKKLDKGGFDRRQAEYLTLEWHADPAGCLAQLQRFWPGHRGQDVIAAAADGGDWWPVRLALPDLRRYLRRGMRVGLGERLREQRRRLRRWRHPAGMLVAVLGPDGAGKSTVIEGLMEDWSETFRRSRMYHLRPRLGQSAKQRGIAVTDPHGKSARGGLFSFFKLAWFLMDYKLGYWFRLRPGLARTTLVVFDRYYHDLFLDPVRYRYGAPLWLARLTARLVPSPDLWLVLDARSETLLMRKAEVSFEASLRQRHAYRSFVHAEPAAKLIDTDRPSSAVRAQVNRVMLDWLAARAADGKGENRIVYAGNPATATVLLALCRWDIPVLSRMVRIVLNSDIYCSLRWPIYLPHPYGVIIHSKARIGRRVTIMQQVTIGSRNSLDTAPVIEDDVYIGAGAKVLGNVRVGRAAAIGANAVVTRDVPPYATVVGANRILERRPEVDTETNPPPRLIHELAGRGTAGALLRSGS